MPSTTKASAAIMASKSAPTAKTAVVKALRPKLAPQPKAAPVSAPRAASTTSPSPAAASAIKKISGGPYAGTLNSLARQDAEAQGVAARRQNDNIAYQSWMQANQSAAAGQARTADDTAARRQAAVQMLTAGAQAQTQKTLDAQRAGRNGGVSDGPGSSRARLAGDDTLTQSLLAANSQRGAEAARSSQDKAGFLAAATAATGSANAARIRADEGADRGKIRDARTDTLMRRSDRISADRAAAAQAAQDAADMDAKLAMQQQSIDARLQIADASNATRAQIAQAGLSVRQSEGAANRSLSSRTTAARLRAADKGGGVSAAETRQRADDVRSLAVETGQASDLARVLKSDPKNKTTAADARAAIRSQYPNITREAMNAALSGVFDPKAKGGRPRGRAASELRRALVSRAKGR